MHCRKQFVTSAEQLIERRVILSAGDRAEYILRADLRWQMSPYSLLHHLTCTMKKWSLSKGSGLNILPHAREVGSERKHLSCSGTKKHFSLFKVIYMLAS